MPATFVRLFVTMPFSKESAFEHLSETRRAGRLAHAYLLTGPAGSGKSWLAVRLAALVLECTPESALAHPDMHIVQPESKSRRIVIDQIRVLEHSIQRKPLVASSKVAIIHDADRLQPQAANAFLKTLEEPPQGSLILLLSTRPNAILETVRSRCAETPLMDTARRIPTEEELAILKALEDCLVNDAKPGVAAAFRFTRSLQSIIAGLREKISSEYEAILRKETARYKQACEDSSWLEERTGQIKALVEAGALRERDRILQIVADTMGEALRVQHGFPAENPIVNSLAKANSTQNLLRRLDALESLRRRLALGVQESLALESGILEMIADSRDNAEQSLVDA
ncbi:MAG: ATP-binding protein [Terrimicrobiaceae bacterium]